MKLRADLNNYILVQASALFQNFTFLIEEVSFLIDRPSYLTIKKNEHYKNLFRNPTKRASL